MLSMIPSQAMNLLSSNIVKLEGYIETFQAVFTILERLFVGNVRINQGVLKLLCPLVPQYEVVTYRAKGRQIVLNFYLSATQLGKAPSQRIILKTRSKSRISEQFMLSLFEKQYTLVTSLETMKAYSTELSAELLQYNTLIRQTRELQENICRKACFHSGNGSTIARLINQVP